MDGLTVLRRPGVLWAGDAVALAEHWCRCGRLFVTDDEVVFVRIGTGEERHPRPARWPWQRALTSWSDWWLVARQSRRMGALAGQLGTGHPETWVELHPGSMRIPVIEVETLELRGKRQVHLEHRAGGPTPRLRLQLGSNEELQAMMTSYIDALSRTTGANAPMLRR